uniref:Protein quiver n=1 Tax=Trichuris muris TaxID=70415 RepID=A0A5S6QTL0_TRIMR
MKQSPHIVVACICTTIFTSVFSYRCYVCNKDPAEDDQQLCQNKLEECPTGVTSCSMLLYKSSDGSISTRKFCTAQGTPVHNYMLSYPGSSFCHNIDTSTIPEENDKPTYVEDSRGQSHVIMPPAPPTQLKSTFLCVCGKELCNKEDHIDMVQKLVLEPLQELGIGGKNVNEYQGKKDVWTTL